MGDYVAAGGIVLRDMFQGDNGGWLQDVMLVDQMVTDTLKTDAATVAAEGWKWIEVPGTKLAGQYDSSVAFGRSGILVGTRIIMLDRNSIVLERQPGARI